MVEQMIFIIAASAIYIIVETIYLIIRRNTNGSRENITMASLRKFMEYNVLNMTLKNPVTSEQASAYEYKKLFLRVEFIYSKPWLAYLFDLSECVTIGRSRDNKIIIRDEKLSRLHCKIYMFENAVYLQNLGASNGTYITGKWFRHTHLVSQETALIEDGDVIRIGAYRLKVRFYYGYQAVG